MFYQSLQVVVIVCRDLSSSNCFPGPLAATLGARDDCSAMRQAESLRGSSSASSTPSVSPWTWVCAIGLLLVVIPQIIAFIVSACESSAEFEEQKQRYLDKFAAYGVKNPNMKDTCDYLASVVKQMRHGDRRPIYIYRHVLCYS